MRKYFVFLSVLYLLSSIGLYFAQEKVIFAAHPYNNSSRYSMGTEYEIPITDDLEMNAVLIEETPGKKSDKVFLYFHGNKGNNKRGIYQSRVMRNKGCDVFIVDYRGYGKTEGNPINDAQLLDDANAAYKYLTQWYNEENIYVLGYSLGSGMASYVASQNSPAYVFLVAPFISLEAIKDQWLWMFPDFLLKFKLDNHKHLREVNCGVTIVHGTKDPVIPYSHSESLKASYPDVNLITLPNQNHRGVIFDKQLRMAIEKVVAH